MSFCSLTKGITQKICRLRVCVLINLLNLLYVWIWDWVIKVKKAQYGLHHTEKTRPALTCTSSPGASSMGSKSCGVSLGTTNHSLGTTNQFLCFGTISKRLPYCVIQILSSDFLLASFKFSIFLWVYFLAKRNSLSSPFSHRLKSWILISLLTGQSCPDALPLYLGHVPCEHSQAAASSPTVVVIVL